MSVLRNRITQWGWTQRARIALALGKQRTAIQCFENLLQFNPLHRGARTSIATLSAELGDPARAELEISRIVADHPDDAAAHFNLGYLLEQREALHEAETCFRHAVELDARLDRAWYGLGLCLIKQGRLAESVRPLEECTRLQPMSPYAWYQLARANHDLGRHEEAGHIVERLQGFEPKVAAQLRRELEIPDDDAFGTFPMAGRAALEK